MTVSHPSKSHSPVAEPMGVARRPLLWLNAVCLDAPLVAVGWQWLFAWSLGFHLSTAGSVALFLTAWLIYLIDRLGDALSLRRAAPRSLRADFFLRHKNGMIGLTVLAGALDGWTIFHGLGQPTIVLGIIFGAAIGIYLVTNFVGGVIWKTIAMKELFIGFLFTAGTLLFFFPQPGRAQAGFILAALLLACLCSLNCMSIAVWEREVDLAQGKHSIATRRRVDSSVRGAVMMLAGLCLLLLIVQPEAWPLAICLVVGAVLLTSLHFLPVRRDERVALADLILLTPWLVLLGPRLA